MYDLVVIGGGAAGLAAARQGVRLGAGTLMVADGPIGGDCTFTGCVPSKTLISAIDQGVGFADAMDRVRATIDAVAATEDDDVLRAEGVEVLRGRARFASPGTIDVDGRRIEGRRFVVATGSEPDVPLRVEGECYTTDSLWDLKALPASLDVVGAGPVGCELAQAFARAGSRVSLCEAAETVLPGADPDAAALLEEALRRDGVVLRLDSEAPGSGSAEAVLVATGRRPVADGLGLDAVGVDLDANGIVTRSDLRTTSKHIWAAGDVTGRLGFTHAADEMGRLAANNALGRRSRRFSTDAIPTVTFTDPEVAQVGVPEHQAIGRRGVRVAVHRDVDRATIEGRADALVKLVAAPRLGNLGGGRLIGATVVGPRAGDLIGELALAVRTRMFVGRLAQTVHPYPTWSVGIRHAAASFFGTGDPPRPPRGS